MSVQPPTPIPSEAAGAGEVGAAGPVAGRIDAGDHALARGVLYGALALALQPPDPNGVSRLESPDAGQALGDAAALLDAADGRLRHATARFLLGVGAEGADDRARRFTRLFGHITRGMVCLYETEYGIGTVYGQPQMLADIAGYYRAFGLQPAGDTRGRPDHVGCECAFMEYLSLKEAYCLEAVDTGSPADESPDRETLLETRRVAQIFLRDHLGRFGVAFAHAAVRADDEGFYASAARLLLRLIELDCERLGIPQGPATLELRPDAEEPVPMACGEEPELIQIQRSRPPA